MKSLAKIRKRLSRCYELAAKAMLYEPGADQWVLVHGSGVNPDHGVRLHHAWIELNDGRVQIPTSTNPLAPNLSAGF